MGEQTNRPGTTGDIEQSLKRQRFETIVDVPREEGLGGQGPGEEHVQQSEPHGLSHFSTRSLSGLPHSSLSTPATESCAERVQSLAEATSQSDFSLHPVPRRSRPFRGGGSPELPNLLQPHLHLGSAACGPRPAIVGTTRGRNRVQDGHLELDHLLPERP